MYSLLRNATVRKQLVANAGSLLVSQAFALIPALVVTQLFYHWKSFLLEFVGFLVTWLVIDFAVTSVRSLFARRRTGSHGA